LTGETSRATLAFDRAIDRNPGNENGAGKVRGLEMIDGRFVRGQERDPESGGGRIWLFSTPRLWTLLSPTLRIE
jgi:hypothetical protein